MVVKFFSYFFLKKKIEQFEEKQKRMNRSKPFLCKCREICKVLECKNGQNKGKFFVTCPKKQCKYFQWVKEPIQTTSPPTSPPPPPPLNHITSNNQEEIPICPTHNLACKQFQVKKKESTNFGKYFFKCCVRDGANEECKFFKWCKLNIPITSTTSTSSAPNFTSEYLELELMEWKFNQILEIAVAIKLSSLEKCSTLVEHLKSISSLKQIKDKKDYQFIFSFKEYSKAITLLQQFCNLNSCTLITIPSFVLEIVNSNNFKTMKHELNLKQFEEQINLVPQKLLESMLPFQKETLQFALERNGKIIIADEMGLGKSLQSIAVMCCYLKNWPLLIICPASLKQNWNNELLKWIGSLSSSDIQILETKSDELKDCLITIASYEIASSEPLLSKLYQNKFESIICDESHYLKSDSTKRTKSLFPLISNAKRAILLSGTISPSRPIEIYSQIKALNVFPETLTKKLFGERYCLKNCGLIQQQQYSSSSQMFTESRNLRELNLILSNKVMIRRLKLDVVKDLPKKNRQQVILQLNKEEMKQYNQIQTSYQSHFDKSKVSKLYQETCKCKIHSVCKYVKQFVKNYPKQKFLIFAHHLEMLDGIENYIKQKLHFIEQKHYIRIDGTTATAKRQNLVNFFKTEQDCVVAILSITAASTGLDFTPANNVLFAELSWVPGLHLQAEDRVHRLSSRGSESNCDIRYLIAKNTLDEYMWKILMKKIDIVGLTMDGNELQENENWNMGEKIKWNHEIDSNQMTLDLFLSNNSQLKKRKQDVVEEENKENISPNLIEPPLKKSKKALESSNSNLITKYLKN